MIFLIAFSVVMLILLIITAVFVGETKSKLVRKMVINVSIVAVVLVAGFWLVRSWVMAGVDCQPDCVGVNLIGRDLSGLNLRGVNFVEANLQSVDLSGSDLSGADLSGANLSYANLENADLENASLMGANLLQAQLRGTNMTNTFLNGADLIQADLTGVDLTQATLGGAVFEQAKLVEVNLQGTDIAGVGFTAANLQGANLAGAQLQGARLSQANLGGSFLQGSNMSGAWLNLATVTGANLTGANLSGAALIGANMGSAQLDGARLFGAVLVGAQLEGVTLRGADLSSARLFYVELRNADLLLDPALQELNELQLREIYQDVLLSGVQFNEETTWPMGKDVLLAQLLGQQYVQLTASVTLQTDIAEPSGEAQVVMAGSSTVAPLSSTLYNAFINEGNTATVEILSSGTSSGFRLFCETKESDIAMASQPMGEADQEACALNGRTPVELRIGLDTMTVQTSQLVTFIQDATTEELARIFTAERWFDVNSEWPQENIIRFIPEESTGTFELFVDQIFEGDAEPLLNAPETYTNSDKNEVIRSIIQTPYSVGFTGIAYYQQNSEVLRLLTINGIAPSSQTVENGEYLLARPLLLYVDPATLRENPEAIQFLTYYLENVNSAISQLGYFPLSDDVLQETRTQFQAMLSD